jgi:hypothetical protein
MREMGVQGDVLPPLDPLDFFLFITDEDYEELCNQITFDVIKRYYRHHQSKWVLPLPNETLFSFLKSFNNFPDRRIDIPDLLKLDPELNFSFDQGIENFVVDALPRVYPNLNSSAKIDSFLHHNKTKIKNDIFAPIESRLIRKCETAFFRPIFPLISLYSKKVEMSVRLLDMHKQEGVTARVVWDKICGEFKPNPTDGWNAALPPSITLSKWDTLCDVLSDYFHEGKITVDDIRALGSHPPPLMSSEVALRLSMCYFDTKTDELVFFHST